MGGGGSGVQFGEDSLSLGTIVKSIKIGYWGGKKKKRKVKQGGKRDRSFEGWDLTGACVVS